MTVILLCGYRRPDADERALFIDSIDRRIREIKNLGHDVVCVLAGEFAEDQLRYCRNITACELVFDTQDEPNLATNLKAGLAGTDGSGCYALPVEIPCPPREVWESLREVWRHRGFLTKTNLYKAETEFGFPLLVTRVGNTEIKGMPEFRSLLDTRLKYHADLASKE